MTTKTTEIKLVQAPIIQHKLVEVGASVTTRIEELNLDKLVATDETIQSLKQLRADLNKELKEFEEQRKTLKNAVAKPYQDFETIYKEEVSEKFKNAVDILKEKIAEFENKVKKEKKENIERYFNELAIDSNIDFVKFKDTGIEINLSTSEKKYKEQCYEFLNRVADDIIMIQGTDYAAETMAEYKTNGLNASKAITTINERKEAERLEAERIKQAETDRRQNMLRNIAMVHHDMTKTFIWVQDDSVFITDADIEKLSTEDFEKRFVEIEAKVKAGQKNITQADDQPHAPEKPTPAQAVGAPVKEAPVEKEKTFKATFECEGTMKQLKALGQYMKDNGITYKNL